MGILENEQDRAHRRQPRQLRQQCLQRFHPLKLGIQIDPAVPVLQLQTEKRGYEWCGSRGVLRTLSQQALKFVELLVGRISRCKSGRTSELLCRGVQRAVGVVGRALIADTKMGPVGNLVYNRLCDTRLPDSRLAAQQDHLSLAVFCLAPSLQEERELLVAADNRLYPLRSFRVVPALQCSCPVDPKRLHLTVETLESLLAHIRILEQVAREIAGGLRDDQRIGVRE